MLRGLEQLYWKITTELDWDEVLKTGALLPGVTKSAAQLEAATEQLQAFQSFCDLAREHMITLVMEVAKARAGVASELVSRTRIVVATMDAYCKYKAGRLQGAARGVLDKLRTKLALVDESEAYALDQAVAGLGGIGAFETVVALGDWHQRLEDFQMNPAFTRVPWVSGAPGEVDPGESQDEDRWGTGGDDPKNSKKTPNAKRQPLQEFLKRAPSAELTHSKRFGNQVTNFIQRLMQFAASFVPNPNGQDSTWLWHVFYDGQRWEPSAVENVSGDKGRKGTTGLARSINPVALVVCKL